MNKQLIICHKIRQVRFSDGQDFCSLLVRGQVENFGISTLLGSVKYNFTNIIAFELHRIKNWCRFTQQINTEGYSKSTEPIDAVNILPPARFEPTTSTTPPSTTPDATLRIKYIYILIDWFSNPLGYNNGSNWPFLFKGVTRKNC